MGAACLGGADAGGAGRERLLLADAELATEAFALLLAFEARELRATE